MEIKTWEYFLLASGCLSGYAILFITCIWSLPDGTVTINTFSLGYELFWMDFPVCIFFIVSALYILIKIDPKQRKENKKRKEKQNLIDHKEIL